MAGTAARGGDRHRGEAEGAHAGDQGIGARGREHHRRGQNQERRSPPGHVRVRHPGDRPDHRRDPHSPGDDHQQGRPPGPAEPDPIEGPEHQRGAGRVALDVGRVALGPIDVGVDEPMRRTDGRDERQVLVPRGHGRRQPHPAVRHGDDDRPECRRESAAERQHGHRHPPRRDRSHRHGEHAHGHRDQQLAVGVPVPVAVERRGRDSRRRIQPVLVRPQDGGDDDRTPGHDADGDRDGRRAGVIVGHRRVGPGRHASTVGHGVGIVGCRDAGARRPGDPAGAERGRRAPVGAGTDPGRCAGDRGRQRIDRRQRRPWRESWERTSSSNHSRGSGRRASPD